MKILVTGGLGYIGSHTVVELQKANYEVLIVDNCSNASLDVLDGITAITGVKPACQVLDLKDKTAVNRLLEAHTDIAGVIHFAASKAVGESVQKPLEYYENNIAPLVYLLQALQEKPDCNLIFSSSCTVYGQAKNLPITETAPIMPAESPYGNTKQIGEEIIKDICKVNPKCNAIALRYFNPIGAHHTSHIGELPLGTPQNLVPYITQTGAGLREKLAVFGNDYPTKDGTCIRDYIHVVDLAKAHVVALTRLLENKNQTNFEIFNIGTGKGSTVLEVIAAFEKVSEQALNYAFAERRTGDITAAYADTTLANTELGWQATLSLEDAMRDAWNWEKKIRNL